jgi:hypothetical protein
MKNTVIISRRWRRWRWRGSYENNRRAVRHPRRWDSIGNRGNIWITIRRRCVRICRRRLESIG